MTLKRMKKDWTPKHVLQLVDKLAPLIGPLSRELLNRRALADIEALYRVRALVLPVEQKRLKQVDASLDRAFKALADDDHGQCMGFDGGGRIASTVEAEFGRARKARKGRRA